MIIYLHGFASSGNSEKVTALKERFGEQNVIAPDLPIDPTEVENLVRNIIKEQFALNGFGTRIVFVGTSLGAFYAGFCATKFDCPAVIVNPSVQPNITLLPKLGRNVNHVTKEEFYLTLVHLETLREMREYFTENYQGSLYHLFAAKDDEVIPYEEMLAWYKYTASTTVTETGKHRFEDNWNLVLDKISEIQ